MNCVWYMAEGCRTVYNDEATPMKCAHGRLLHVFVRVEKYTARRGATAEKSGGVSDSDWLDKD